MAQASRKRTRSAETRRIEPTLGPAGGAPRGGSGSSTKRPADESDSGKRKAAPRRRGAKRRKSSGGQRSGLLHLLGRFVYWCLVLSLWGGIGATAILGYTFATLPQTDEWKVPARPPNIEIVDREGRLIANRGDTGGKAVRLEQLPAHLPQAVMAIEDRRFYSHFGIDPLGLARAAITNFTAGDVVQGGSTLTQQLAKNLFLEPDRTLERKLQEVVLSLWLEWKYSKDEILEMYLNRVYLGGGAYGVDAAARRYFAKSAADLTLEESAVLAGLLKAPSRFAPSRDPELAARRAATVLAAMTEEGYITSAEAKAAAETGPTRVSTQSGRAENYVADWVMELLPGYVGSVSNDLVVETTIDVGMQRAAEAALRETLAHEGAEFKVSQGALVAIADDGEIRALVGGRNYAESQFNRAVAAKRQPGSSFKPFVYLAAVERGYGPDHIMVDEPVSIRGWTPQNYTREYLGPVTLSTALAKSLNTVAARLAAEVGPANVAATARRVGIVSRLHENPSIALGTAEVTPLEITGAYVPFANGGRGVIPFVISRITAKDGTVLFARQPGDLGEVIDPRSVAIMNQMLRGVMEHGTGQKALLPGRPAAGKTGTSQDFRDAWFLGYVPGLTAGVWLGNDDNSPTGKATGGSLTSVVWRRFMIAATDGMPVRPLPGNDFTLPMASDPAIADGDGLATPGVISSPLPPAEVPVSGPTDAERSLLDRLFSG